MTRVAVTGGIAEGKSTVLQIAADQGYATVSADAIGREVFAEPETQQSIRKALDLEHSPDLRTSVRELIAADRAARARLNEITHPEILARMFAQYPERTIVLYEVPLLIETCIQRLFDQTWVVTCGKVEQLRRLTERLGDQAQAEALIAAQIPTRAKFAFADLVIRTDIEMPLVHRTVVAALSVLGDPDR